MLIIMKSLNCCKYFRQLYRCFSLDSKVNYNLSSSFAMRDYKNLWLRKNNDTHIFKKNLVNLFSRSMSIKKYNPSRYKISPNTPEVQFDEKELDDDKYKALMNKFGGKLEGISTMAVIQPWIKWGSKKRRDTNPDLLLNEACALVRSLPYVTVTYKEYVPVQIISKNHIFGSGTLERLVEEVKNSNSHAVFISVDHLTRVQKISFEEEFGKPVFDRFFIVLSIFKHHARTAEARLQIAMAEMPFMSKRYISDKERFILNQREAMLKSAVKNLESRRERVRKAREASSIPSVAVIGYTNCGRWKTTLIRALTGDERLQGEDRLFATLDVTAHKGPLPCGLNVLFLDSVGFIQDIPTSLIASFAATLQDTIYADVVVLVRDISHPDAVSQTKTVKETLESLQLPKTTPIVMVNNKSDLIEENVRHSEEYQGQLFTSAITGEGLIDLLEAVEKNILTVTRRKKYHMKFLTGSAEIDWLNKNVGVTHEEVDKENPQYTHIYVVLSESEKAAFRRAFRPQ